MTVGELEEKLTLSEYVGWIAYFEEKGKTLANAKRSKI